MDKKQFVAKAEMLIRKPVEEVFEAFVNPEITTKFWFTKSSGRLDEHSEVQWTWEMYGHSVAVKVLEMETPRRIKIEWGNRGEISVVEWTFTSIDRRTFVSVANNGFTGSDEEQLSMVRDSTEGFALVLAGAKALLEYGVELNLVRDRFPDGV